MTDNPFDADLESIAGSLGMPSSFQQLRSLLQSLPAPLPPEIRSAITGQVSTSEPGTQQAQIASTMTGSAPGSESGAALGVVSEIYYANSNLLDNPTFAGMNAAAAVAITPALTDVDWAERWQAFYVLNSGVAPTVTIELIDDRFQANGFHPFNVNLPFVKVVPGAGAFDATVVIHPRSSWQQFFDTQLAYVTAAMKASTMGGVHDANTTVMQTWVELWDTNGGGTLLATSPVIDWLDPAINVDSVYRQTAFDPSTFAATYAYQMRFCFRVAKSSAAGWEGMNFGEAVMALTTTQAPPPFSPIIGRWRPSSVRVANAGDTRPRLLVGAENDESVASPAIQFGPGGGTAPDVQIKRRTAGGIQVSSLTAADDALAVGDDAEIFDVDVADSIGIRGQGTPANARLYFGSGKDIYLFRQAAGELKASGHLDAAGIVTGNHGAAGKAVQVGTSDGGATTGPGITFNGDTFLSRPNASRLALGPTAGQPAYWWANPPNTHDGGLLVSRSGDVDFRLQAV
ncbi:MAG TPA: hypothetical protein VIU37_10715, partial [Candidatus Limnocylindrales bacterium]